MAINLSSVYAKLLRAEDHTQTVKNEVRAWMNGNPYSVTKEPNADFTRYSLFLHVSQGPSLERWGLMIGDGIHCLRCVLDHLVYAIAVHELGREPPPNADILQFPIADSAENFARDSKRRLSALSDPVRTVIESLQPYNRPHPQLPPLLAMLRDFDNADKHKLLTLATATIAQGNLGFRGPDTPIDGTAYFSAWNQMEDGAEIAAISFNSPTPNMEYDKVDLLAVLALIHKKGASGSDRTDFASLLSLLIVEVRAVVELVVAAVKP